MCGIAGFLNADASWGGERLHGVAKAMGEAVFHRGPDAGGEFVVAEVGLGLAHRRLSILDLSEAGAQPMGCRSGRWTVVFNGELYNHARVRREIEGARGGFAWRGHSDTETLVEALEEWGPEQALARFDGMFAFAAWDAHERRLVLARDRLGEKPLYWGVMPDGCVLFGSELRALYPHPAWHGELDRDAVALLMHYNCIPEPHSIWRHVRKLAPGHWLEVRDRRPGEPRPYWSLDQAMARGADSRGREPGPDAAWIDRLDGVLGEVVEEQMLADVPLGAFLSGGIDSSLVVAMMQRHASGPVKTFTIGFAEDGFDEAVHARAVAAHLGTEHHEETLSARDAMAMVPAMATEYDEPFADSSQLPTSLVARFAHRHVKVALSGDGGDEVFAGYTRYVVGDGLWRRLAPFPYPLRNAVAAGIEALPARFWDGAARRLGPLTPRLLRASSGEKMQRIARILRARSPAAYYDDLISHWKDPALIVPGAHLPALERARAIAVGAGSDLEFMMAHDALVYLPADIMVKVDRAAMAVSLETRAPFLDRRLVEFAWEVPLSLKLRDGKGKWLMRELLARYLPRSMFERPKQGFGVPLGEWLRGGLREWAEELLAPPRLAASGFIDPGPVQVRWREHLAGRTDWHYYLWDVLMFQQWYERYGPMVGSRSEA